MNAGVATTGRRSQEAGERVGTPGLQWHQPRAADRWPRRGIAASRNSRSLAVDIHARPPHFVVGGRPEPDSRTLALL